VNFKNVFNLIFGFKENSHRAHYTTQLRKEVSKYEIGGTTVIVNSILFKL